VSLHPQVVAMMQKVAALNLPPNWKVTLQQARANSRLARTSVELQIEPVHSVEDRTIPGPAGSIAIRVYRPDDRPGHPLVMLYHGGGWVVGDLDTEDTTCRGLCNRVNAVVVSVDYRLAPETVFPGAVKDCYAATLWAVDHAVELGINPSQIATSGTSAGGNLSGAVSMVARDRAFPAIAHQVLFCPIIDCDFDRPSYIKNGVDYGLTRDSMIWFWDQYTPSSTDRHSPYVSLIRSRDLSGLPDATVIAAEYDPLLDESVAYAESLTTAGVKTCCTVYEGMTHAFNVRTGVLDAAKHALDKAAAGIRESFALRST